jgi:hypothetical protein
MYGTPIISFRSLARTNIPTSCRLSHSREHYESGIRKDISSTTAPTKGITLPTPISPLCTSTHNSSSSVIDSTDIAPQILSTADVLGSRRISRCESHSTGVKAVNERVMCDVRGGGDLLYRISACFTVSKTDASRPS